MVEAYKTSAKDMVRSYKDWGKFFDAGISLWHYDYVSFDAAYGHDHVYVCMQTHRRPCYTIILVVDRHGH